MGDAFLDASGIPGPAMGHINMFLGHTDTGKTTALVKTALDAQRKEILPVLIITEQKWDFSHAKLLGMECEETVDEETDDGTGGTSNVVRGIAIGLSLVALVTLGIFGLHINTQNLNCHKRTKILDF